MEAYARALEPGKGSGSSSHNRRKQQRAEWRRLSRVMVTEMRERDMNPQPAVWQLISDAALVDALGSWYGNSLVAHREEYAVWIGRALKAEKR